MQIVWRLRITSEYFPGRLIQLDEEGNLNVIYEALIHLVRREKKRE